MHVHVHVPVQPSRADFWQNPEQPNLKHHSPLSESDRGGSLLKIRLAQPRRKIVLFRKARHTSVENVFDISWPEKA